ncbi:MAG: mechanosensitive ion channel family protein [Myxococcales bacterium]
MRRPQRYLPSMPPRWNGVGLVTDSWLIFAGFALAVVVVAGFLRLAPLAPRHRLRRSVILLGFYAAVLVLQTALHWVHAPEVVAAVQVAAELVQLLIVINLVAIALFDLTLRACRIGYPDILHDVVVGAAYVAAFGFLMHRAGVNVTSIVATSAVVTAVIGLSLQATLGNVVGGISLQLDDSLNEGDWIELENKTQGQIKKIRWRHTVIETRDWDTLIVPNGQLMTQALKVLGKRNGQPLQHRMWVYFNVDFRYAPAEVMRAVNDALQAAPIPGAALEPKPHCICYDLARDTRDSYCYYAVRYWLTDIARDDPTSSLVRERIYAALKRAQIPLAIPAKTVFVSPDDLEHRNRKRARELDARISALAAIELFETLSDDERRILASSARLAPFSAREVITRQGAAAHWLYVLLKGTALVRVASSGGEERQVAILESPSFFGEMALMTGQPREATVIAETDVECLRVDRKDLERIIKDRPEIASEISGVLAARRVELLAVREGLDSDQKRERLDNEHSRILNAIQSFFALK